MTQPSLQDIVESASLPTLPTVAVELLELTRNPDVSLEEIEKLVQSDPGLAARVIRTVNSSLFGLRQPCTSIKRALAYLGLNAVKSLVLGFSLVDLSKFATEFEGFDFGAYWKRIIYSTAGARQIAEVTTASDPDEAFTCGIFQDIGILANISAMDSEYIKLLAEADDDYERLADLERKAFGFTHPEVGAAVAEKWHLPDAIVSSIRHQFSPEAADEKFQDLVRAVILGRFAARTFYSSDPAQALANLMVETRNWYGQESDDLQSMLERITTTADDLAQVLDQNIKPIPDISTILEQANEQQIQHQIAVQREMTELRETNQTLEVRSTTDPLTGVANRLKFDEEFDRLFTVCEDTSEPLSVMFMDADHFKSVNDTYGHQTGDAVLIELAVRLRQVVGDAGIVCRYGGEEFAVLLPNCSGQRALRLAEVARSVIETPEFELSGVEGAPPKLPITVSIGVASTQPNQPDLYKDAAQLLRDADEGVYEAKESGRNCVRMVAPGSGGETKIQSDEKPTHVLIIEDDSLAASILTLSLERAGATSVNLVTSGKETTAYLKGIQDGGNPTPDLVLVDFNLPDCTGADLVTLMRKTVLLANTPIVAVTASSRTADLNACRVAGVEDVCSKMAIADDIEGWAQDVLQQWTTPKNRAA